MILLFFIVVIGSLVALGRWRKFGAVQWIWTIAGLGIGIFIVWGLLIVFLIGPEMKDAVVPWK